MMAQVWDIIQQLFTNLYRVVWLPIKRKIWAEYGDGSQVRLPYQVFATTLNIAEIVAYYLFSAGYCLSNSFFQLISPRHIGRMSRDDQEAFERKNACYQYASLDVASQEIRLIELAKLSPFSKPLCTLLIVPLDRAPDYEAISYTWAGQPPDHYVELVHNKWIRVTENVFKIIHDMASFRARRYLWIDAICINQSDLDEKRSQVEMMGDIYTNATAVVAWLGGSSDVPAVEVPRMLNLLNRIKYCIPSHEELRAGLEQGKHFVGSRESWEAFHRFIGHPYWKRVWIIQEMVLAREVTIFFAGQYIPLGYIEEMFPLEHEVFREVMIRESTAFGLSLLDSGELEFNMIGLIRMQIQRQMWIPLASAIRTTHSFKCSDPRDKAYGLMALINPDERLPADYTISPEEVFTRVASEILRRGGVVLDQAGIGYLRQLNSLPTWVPDWTLYSSKVKENLDLYAPHSRRYSAGGHGPMAVEMHKHRTIKLELIPISKIRYLGPSYPRFTAKSTTDPTSPDNIGLAEAKFLHKAAAFFSEKTPAIYTRTGQPRTEAVWRTIIGDRIRTAADRSKVVCPAPPEFERYFEISFLPFGTPCGIDVQTIQLNIGFYTRAMFANCNSRRAAVAQDMTMLVVPELAEEGDLVCVLPGMHSPLVLREKQHSAGENGAERAWELVGDCYAHGLMFGEALNSGRQQTFNIQ